MKLVVELIQNLYWPIVDLVMFFYLKKDLAFLLKNISNLKYDKLEIEWQKREMMEAKKKEIENIPISLGDETDRQAKATTPFEKLKIDPDNLLDSAEKAWNAVSAAMNNLARESGNDHLIGKKITEMAYKLQQNKVITDEQLRFLTEMSFVKGLLPIGQFRMEDVNEFIHWANAFNQSIVGTLQKYTKE